MNKKRKTMLKKKIRKWIDLLENFRDREKIKMKLKFNCFDNFSKLHKYIYTYILSLRVFY